MQESGNAEDRVMSQKATSTELNKKADKTSVEAETKRAQLAEQAIIYDISALKKNYVFAGIATPTTNPGTPDVPVFYIATEAGIYANFNGIEVADGEAVILEWKGNWVRKVVGFATAAKVSELEREITRIDLSKSFLPNEMGIVINEIGSIVDFITEYAYINKCFYAKITEGDTIKIKGTANSEQYPMLAITNNNKELIYKYNGTIEPSEIEYKVTEDGYAIIQVMSNKPLFYFTYSNGKNIITWKELISLNYNTFESYDINYIEYLYQFIKFDVWEKTSNKYTKPSISYYKSGDDLSLRIGIFKPGTNLETRLVDILVKEGYYKGIKTFKGKTSDNIYYNIIVDFDKYIKSWNKPTNTYLYSKLIGDDEYNNIFKKVYNLESVFNDGTPNSFSTEFINALDQSGDYFEIPEGSYYFNNKIDIPKKNLTIKGKGNVIIKAPAINIYSDYYTVFENIHFINTKINIIAEKNIIPNTEDSTHYLTMIHNCTIESSPIKIYGTSDFDAKYIVIKNNLFNKYYWGIFADMSYSVISNNVFVSEGYPYGNPHPRSAIRINSGTNNLITGNRINGGVTGIIFMNQSYDGGTRIANISNNTVSNNIIQNIHEEGISFDGSTIIVPISEIEDVSLPNYPRIFKIKLSDNINLSNVMAGDSIIITSGELSGSLITVKSIENNWITIEDLDSVTYDKIYRDNKDKLIKSECEICRPAIGNIISNNTLKNIEGSCMCLFTNVIGNIITGNTFETCGNVYIRNYVGILLNKKRIVNLVHGNTFIGNSFINTSILSAPGDDYIKNNILEKKVFPIVENPIINNTFIKSFIEFGYDKSYVNIDKNILVSSNWRLDGNITPCSSDIYTITLKNNDTMQFYSPAQDAEWSVEGNIGTITDKGLFTANNIGEGYVGFKSLTYNRVFDENDMENHIVKTKIIVE